MARPQNEFYSVIEVTPTISASVAYTTGDQLGGIQTLTVLSARYGQQNFQGARLEAVSIVDRANQKSAIDILFFNASPTLRASDNAAVLIADAEMASKCIGIVSIAAASYVTVDATAGNAVVTTAFGGILLPPALEGTDIYALAVVRGTPTYGATSDLVFKYHLQRNT